MAVFLSLLFPFVLVAVFLRFVGPTATASVYNVPYLRLFDPRWAITRTGLVYVFRGRKWYSPWPFAPMVAIYWWGNTDAQTREASERIVVWANQHKLRKLPDIPALVDAANYKHNDRYRYTTVNELMEYLEEWRLGKRSGSQVVEVHNDPA